MSSFRRCESRSGFSVLESVIAITLLSFASAMVFSATFPAINHSFRTRNSLIAHQHATQLLDEILQRPIGERSGTAAPQALHASRESLRTIRQFDGYRSHMSLPNGQSFPEICPDQTIAGCHDICFQVEVTPVDDGLRPGEFHRFLLIKVLAFEDPEKDLSRDGRPLLTSVERLVSEPK